MFAKLAIRNIRRSIKDYAIYFFTLVLGVAIFYLFNSIENQSALIELNSNLTAILGLMTGVLSGISVFVAIILGFLIIYASRFLMKRRSREFGIYLTLGMSKRKISRLLLFETVTIGLVSLGVGLILGVILSQFVSVLVASLFQANLTHYTFIFSGAAAQRTLLYFAIIYFVVMILNVVVVRRQKILNLLSAGARGEKVKIRKTSISIIVLLASVAMLGWAYYMVTGGITELVLDDKIIYFVLAAGGLGTFLFVRSISGLLLGIFQKCRKLYLKKLNTFSIRQFSDQVNTAVASISIISLMIFVVILVFGASASIQSSMNEEISRTMPLDIEFGEADNVDRSALEIWKEAGLDFSEYIEKTETYRLYYLNGYTWSNLFNDTDEVKNILAGIDYNVTYIYESDYNRLMNLYGGEQLDLNEDEFLVTANFQRNVDILGQLLATSDGEMLIENQKLHNLDGEGVRIASFSLFNGASNTNEGIMIFPDNLKPTGKPLYAERTVGIYRKGVDAVALDDRISAVEEKVRSFGITLRDPTTGENIERDYLPTPARTKQSIIDSSIGLNVLVTFVALYLGLVFLISASTILALKELSNCSDNRERYILLRKLGCSEEELRRSLLTQTALFFLLPLIIAVVHSIPGFIFCHYMLLVFGGVNVEATTMTLTLVIGAIYGGYFLITYFSERRIITEKR